VIWVWTTFIGFVLLMLALDLGVFHRHSHVVTIKEALTWSAVWIFCGLAFSIVIYYGYEGHWFGMGSVPDAVDGLANDGQTAAIKYLTGYIVEKSLSVDNIFVIVMIFGFFAIPALYQHRVLFWGILGALVMRGIMIGVGAKLIAEFHWILLLFGAFLIFTGIKMLLLKSEATDLNQNALIRLAKKLFPVTSRLHGEHFFVRAGSAASHESAMPGEDTLSDEAIEKARPGALMLTPLALALIVVETTDLIFAVDSIPAIFAITADPFLVFTSNVFAILGLRSLYFALAGLMDKFRYLKASLAVILMFVGTKMLTATWLKELLGKSFNFYMMAIVLVILALGVTASLAADRKDTRNRNKPLSS
jgi:tellurite resistance protein TerC